MTYRKSPTVIPYITLRQDEQPDAAETLSVLPAGKGLSYRDEVPRDRDARGVLWSRCTQVLDAGRPVGAPRWKKVHPARQRQAMEELRCQVCMTRTNVRTALGYLILTTAPVGSTARPDWPEGLLTAQPPVCVRHALDAVEQCGYLVREGAVAVRARVPRLYGVIGTLYQPGRGGRPEPAPVGDNDHDIPLPYTNHSLTPWLLASQLVRRLRGVTVVDLEQEGTAAGL